jgi:hypothetical protein
MFEQGRQLDLDVALADCDSERAEGDRYARFNADG